MFKLPVHTELLYVEIISSDCKKHLLECITYYTLCKLVADIVVAYNLTRLNFEEISVINY